MALHSLFGAGTEPLEPAEALICAMLKSALADLESSHEPTRRLAIAFWQNDGKYLEFWTGLLNLDVELLQRLVHDDVAKAIASQTGRNSL